LMGWIDDESFWLKILIFLIKNNLLFIV